MLTKLEADDNNEPLLLFNYMSLEGADDTLLDLQTSAQSCHVRFYVGCPEDRPEDVLTVQFDAPKGHFVTTWSVHEFPTNECSRVHITPSSSCEDQYLSNQKHVSCALQALFGVTHPQ